MAMAGEHLMSTDQHYIWWLAGARGHFGYGYGYYGDGNGATEGSKHIELKNAWGNGMGYGYSEGQCYGCGNMGMFESYSDDTGEYSGCGFSYVY